MKKIVGIISLGIVVVFLLIIGGKFLFEKNKDVEISDNSEVAEEVIVEKEIENNYKNEEGKYSFMLPEEWSVEKKGSSTVINGSDFARIAIAGFEGTIEEYLSFLERKTPVEFVDKKDIEIAGKKSMTFTQAKFRPEGLYYLIERDQEIIVILIKKGYKEQDKEKFSSIISSFKILE